MKGNEKVSPTGQHALVDFETMLAASLKLMLLLVAPQMTVTHTHTDMCQPPVFRSFNVANFTRFISKFLYATNRLSTKKEKQNCKRA